MDLAKITFPIICPDYETNNYAFEEELNSLHKRIRSGKFQRDSWKSEENIIIIKRTCILADYLVNRIDLIDSCIDEKLDVLIELFLPVCIYLK